MGLPTSEAHAMVRSLLQTCMVRCCDAESSIPTMVKQLRQTADLIEQEWMAVDESKMDSRAKDAIAALDKSFGKKQ